MPSRVHVILIIVFLLIATGCTTLRKSQIRLIGNYYSTLADYPGNIKKINERSAEVTLEARSIESALYLSDSLRIYRLVDALNDYGDDLILPDSILNEIDNIENYIRGYYVLVPNGFSIYRTLKGTSESIGSFFGLRPVVSTILPDKTSEISEAKKRKIAKHFRTESAQFRESAVQIKQYIDGHLLPQVQQMNAKIQFDVQRLFKDNSNTISSLDYYFDYNKYFTELFQKIIKTKKLYLSISNSIDLLLETEVEIQQLTKERGKLTADSELLHKLVVEMQRIKILIEETKLD